MKQYNESETLSIVDMKTYKELYSFSDIGQIVSIPVVNGTYVLFGTDDNKLHCINHRTGEIAFELTLDSNIDSSPVLVSRYLYIITNKSLYKIDVYQSKIIWTISNIQGSTGTLIYRESKLYFADNSGFLYCVDESGSMLWKNEVGDGIKLSSVPVFLGDNVCIAGDNGNICSFNSYTGILMKMLRPMGRIASELGVNERLGLIYYVSSDGVLHCIDYASGDDKWVYRFGKYKVAKFITVNDKIYCIVNDGRVFLFDALTGDVLKEASIYKDTWGKPILYGGALYFMDRDNIFYKVYFEQSINKDSYPSGFGQN